MAEPTSMPSLREIHSAHLVGIGGIGMMAVAQYLQHVGIQVSGSDRAPGPLLAHLTASGVTVSEGHAAIHVGHPDVVVVTAAADESNPEVREALRREIPVIKRADLLGRIISEDPQGRSVAVAGTHGKTTTTALTGHLLRASGVDATVLGGGMIRQADGTLAGPALVGSEPIYVVEADEYDRSFLYLRPTISIITSLDFDHPDCYPTIGEMEAAYLAFAQQTSDRLLVSQRSHRATAVAWASGVEFQTYGTTPDSAWSGRVLSSDQNSSTFHLSASGTDVGDFTLRIPGLHNVENAIAAVAAASIISERDPGTFREQLAEFHGTARRLEVKGSVEDITVIDDYAHHPEEVRASLRTLQAHGRPIVVVFQPHTYSRTKALMSEFASAFKQASHVILLDVYAARELPEPGGEASDLAERLEMKGVDTTYVPSREVAVDLAADVAGRSAIVVTMGAGDVGELGPRILERLAEAHVGS